MSASFDLSSENGARNHATAGSNVLVGERLIWETPDGRRVLDGVSFALGRGATGLVGGNGVGKTTLARLLVGELEPTAGVVRRSGRIGWLPQQVQVSGRVVDALGVAEPYDALAAIESGAVDDALFEQVGDAWDLESRAGAVLDRLGLGDLALGDPVDRLSGGEAMRVAIAGCFLDGPDLLVLDEPTNHLDGGARESLYDALRLFPGGLLVISHDRALLRRLDRILELSSRGLRSYGGNYDHYREQLLLEEEAARQRLEDATKRLAQQRRAAQAAAERQARRGRSGREAAARRGLSKIEIQGAKRRAERTTARLSEVHDDRMAQAEAAASVARTSLRERAAVRIDLPATSVPASRVVVEAEGLNVDFGDGALWPEPRDVRMVGPERLALTGPNGSGKSTLARILVGEQVPTCGRVRLNEERIAWLDQRASLLPEGRPLLEGLGDRQPQLTAQEVYWGLDRFGLGRAAAGRLPETLSGGERMRAALVGLFATPTPPRFLVLDEPTNNLDLATVEVLEQALRGYRGALLVISHDVDFLESIRVDRRLELARGRRFGPSRHKLP
ncbi:MAG: ABC-F family ATP-binding cassette domain-containing protein [Acidobacteriota bacterium]